MYRKDIKQLLNWEGDLIALCENGDMFVKECNDWRQIVGILVRSDS